jgi:putative Holliday junction resolvase
MSRYLSIDLGDKRTGLAVGDAVTRIVTPLEVLEVAIAERAGEALLDALVAAIDRQFSPLAKYELVIGLPINMDGTEGPRAKLVRAFAARLADRLKPTRTVHFQDERLTSADADWQLARSGKTHKEKKQLRDALAAATVLRDFLETLPSKGPEVDRGPEGNA